MSNIKSFIKNYGFIIFFFLVLPYFVLIPLFKYETWPAGHDSSGTVFNGWNMVKTLREDFHFPINWQPENFGYKGNPYWVFYQPLSYIMVFLVSTITSLFDSNYVFSALKGAVYLSFLISEVGMFLLLRTILKNSASWKFISTYGSIIYLFAPYRFIDLYSRNAYSEVWVFPWMPFYLLGFYKLFFLKETKGAVLIALSTACLFLSHLMPSFFFIMITHLGFLSFLIIKKRFFRFIFENKKLVIGWLIANIVGGSLASFYILPAMNNIKYLIGEITGFDRINLQHVLDHINWCYDMLDIQNFKGAWQVGQLYLVSFVVLVFLILFSKKETQYKDFMIFLCMSVVITFIFLMSRTLWEHLPPIFYSLQFSWRLFLVYSVFCSVIVALLVNELNIKIPLLIIFFLFHFYTGERFLHFGGGDVVGAHYDSESWLNEIYTKYYTTCNGGGNSHTFLPKTTYPVLFNFDHTDILAPQEKFSNTYLLNLKPGINVLSHKHYGNNFVYELLLDNPAFLVFKQYFYPTWELYIDSKRSKDLYLTDFGYIGFEVPSGKHIIKLRSN